MGERQVQLDEAIASGLVPSLVALEQLAGLAYVGFWRRGDCASLGRARFGGTHPG